MNDRRAILVADLGYGDSGKGITIDTLARTHIAHTVVRYNGGAQAAHTVVTPDGRSHTFSQFGSASFVSGVATYLSAHMLVDPIALSNEETFLERVRVFDALSRHFIHRDARIVSPYAKLINKLREHARRDARHGSCGMGIGETMRFWKAHPDETLYLRDLSDVRTLKRKLLFQLEYSREIIAANFPLLVRSVPELKDEWDELSGSGYIAKLAERYVAVSSALNCVDEEWESTLLQKNGTILFEGAQGVLLDERYGFHPFTTWSDTTYANADTMLGGFDGSVTRLGVLRAYATRHGPGPFVTEDSMLTGRLPDSHNMFGEWQREFRVGWFDAVASRYALRAVGGVDALAITNLDRLEGLSEWKIATRYKTTTDAMRNLSRLPADREGIARDIVRTKEDDEEMNEDLAKELFKAAPAYESVEIAIPPKVADVNSMTPVIEKIEHELDTRVALLGFGPTSNEKYWRKSLF